MANNRRLYSLLDQSEEHTGKRSRALQDLQETQGLVDKLVCQTVRVCVSLCSYPATSCMLVQYLQLQEDCIDMHTRFRNTILEIEQEVCTNTHASSCHHKMHQCHHCFITAISTGAKAVDLVVDQ